MVKIRLVGGQELGPSKDNITPGEMTAAYGWFTPNYGTFATASFGGLNPNASTDASVNIFNDASCSGAGCIGVTELGTWHMLWNGTVIPFGSFGGCQGNNCTTDQLAGILVSNWTVNSDQTYSMDYSQKPPDLDPSGFGNVPLYLHLEGTIGDVADHIQFSEQTKNAGLDHSPDNFGSALSDSGIAWIDYDNDGFQDLFVPGRGTVNESNQFFHLYHNDGNGQFTNVTTNAPDLLLYTSVSVGAAIGDYDGDGFDDIFVTTSNVNRLLHNNSGKGSFTDVTFADSVIGRPDSGLGNGARGSVSASFGDVNGDGYLDLYVANFLGPNEVYINNKNGTFTKVDTGADDTGNAWATVMTDYDQDGDLDIYVINDAAVVNGPGSELYKNNLESGSFSFSPAGAETGLGISIAGMGIAVGDYNNDGFLDYFQTDIGPGSLSTNDGSGFFSTTKLAMLPEPNSDAFFGWGAAFFDANNDGWLDLYHVFGRNTSPFYLNNNGSLLGKPISSVGLENPNHGVATADYDNDGDIDVITSGYHQVHLFRNDSLNTSNWINLNLKGNLPNHRGIGATVRAELTDGTRMMREVHAGSSLGSSHSPVVHFGLGDATQVNTLTVQWPSGMTSTVNAVAADQMINVFEPDYTYYVELRRIDPLLPDIAILTGSGFINGQTQVFFNGVPSGPTQVLNESLMYAFVPDRSLDLYGPITTITPTSTSVSRVDFGQTAGGLALTGFSPMEAQAGSFVYLFGEGFTFETEFSVQINGQNALGQYIADGWAIVIVPPNVSSGKVVITVDGQTAESEFPLMILP